jgi:hypothetical protein
MAKKEAIKFIDGVVKNCDSCVIENSDNGR